MSNGELENRSIFRPEALRRHAASRSAAAMPQVDQPRSFGLLWGVLLLLFVTAAWLFTLKVPMQIQVEGSVQTESRSVSSLVSPSAAEVSP